MYDSGRGGGGGRASTIRRDDIEPSVAIFTFRIDESSHVVFPCLKHRLFATRYVDVYFLIEMKGWNSIFPNGGSST